MERTILVRSFQEAVPSPREAYAFPQEDTSPHDAGLDENPKIVPLVMIASAEDISTYQSLSSPTALTETVANPSRIARVAVGDPIHICARDVLRPAFLVLVAVLSSILARCASAE